MVESSQSTVKKENRLAMAADVRLSTVDFFRARHLSLVTRHF